MVSAKDIVIKPIKAHVANVIVKKIHYSGKVVQNSQLHFGVFLKGKLEGAMQFGPCLDKRKIQGLVKDTLWSGFIELNRMAFSDALPKFSESRAIGITMRIIRKMYPQIKWVISFSDGTQCGDGTIYRASGFMLTGINISKNLCRLPNGVVIHKMTLESNPTSPRPELGGKSYYDITGGKYDFGKYKSVTGGVNVDGFQLRYIYFIDKSYKENLTVPILPFSKIDEMGAGMYKGERLTMAERKDNIHIKRVNEANSSDQLESGGATPTHTLQSKGANNAS